MQEDTRASQEIGKVTHSAKEDAQLKKDYQTLFDKLVNDKSDVEGISPCLILRREDI